MAIMFANLIASIRNGRPVGSNPWGGASLEWSVSSPPPANNFTTEPVVTRGPYDFDGVVVDD